MSRWRPKYPSLTPLRAVDLLRTLDTLPREGISKSTLEEVRDALRNHVKHAIVAKRRRAGR